MQGGSLRHKQARCLLTNTPSASFQAVLQRLSSSDYARLRQVSRQVCWITTLHLPYIKLHLSDISTADQLQQWYMATRHLMGVSCIHVIISVAATAEVFDLAMQLLAQRITPVRELHLLADGECDTMPLLQPLHHLLPHLQVLEIEGNLLHLGAGLSKLTQTAAPSAQAWQLQDLTLCWLGCCKWSTFAHAMTQLVTLFPRLQQLAIQMPTVGIELKDKGQPEATATVAVDHAAFVDDGYLIPYSIALKNSIHYGICYPHCSEAEIEYQAAAAAVAAIAALANAVLQLRQLQTLTVDEAPDVWSQRAPARDEFGARNRSKPPVSAVQIASLDHDSTIAAPTDHGLLVSIPAAVAAFGTLDDCGCWLLQHHLGLRSLHICTDATLLEVCMRWQRSQHPPAGPLPMTISSSSGGGSLSHNIATLSSISVLAEFCAPSAAASPSPSTAVEPANDDSYWTLRALCSFRMSLYSVRPVADIMTGISRLRLHLDLSGASQLHDLLGGLVSMKILEVVLKTRLNKVDVTYKAAEYVYKGAAAVQGLQSLTVECGKEDKLLLSDDLLVPLTAAAGGPGSSLTKLELVGDFMTAPAGAAGTSQLASSTSGWFPSLKQLDGLHSLSIIHAGQASLFSTGADLYSVSIESLPASLTRFQGCNLQIVRGTAAVAAGGGGTDSAGAPSCAASDSQPSDSQPLQLHVLDLTSCQLSHPNILACQVLQQLTVVDSIWSGGWAAAAAAWPNITQLSYKWGLDHGRWLNGGSVSTSISMDSELCHSSNITDGVPDGSGSSNSARSASQDATHRSLLPKTYVEGAVRAMCTGCKSLRSIHLCRMPSLSAEVLQLLAQQMKEVRHLKVAVANEAHLIDVSPICLASTGCRSTSSSFSCCNDQTHLKAARRWLQQQMPWATVIVESPWGVVHDLL